MYLGQVLPTAHLSHKQQFAPCVPRQVVFNISKECQMLHAAETLVMKAASLNCSRRNDCVRFFQKIQRAITPQWEITVIRKIRISYFLMRYPYIKFQ